MLRDKGFTLKIEDDLKDYLSCKIEFTKNKKSAWLGQPHLIANLEKSFGNGVKNLKVYNTPGTAHKIQVRKKDESKCIYKG